MQQYPCTVAWVLYNMVESILTEFPCGAKLRTVVIAGMRPELLHERLISMSSDTVAVVDIADKSKGVKLKLVLKRCTFCCLYKVRTVLTEASAQVGSNDECDARLHRH